MARIHGKRALVFLVCAALLVCLVSLHTFGAHPLYAALVPIFTPIVAPAVTLPHRPVVRLSFQPLSFLSRGSGRAPPVAF